MRYLTLIPLFFLSLFATVQAADPVALYRAEVEVPDQGSEARAEGMGQAMLDVLRKVAGSDRVAGNEALQAATGDAPRHVQQYGYRREALPEVAGEQAERLIMSVRFDARGIDTLLRENGFTVWGATRPETLVWLVVEENGRRVLVGNNDGGAVRGYLAQAAERRALPLRLPLLDLQDRARIQPADIWGEFLEPVEEASARYAPQAILLGRLRPAGAGRWQVSWTLTYQGEVQRWQQTGDVQAVIDEGVGHTAELLMEQFTSGFVIGSDSMLLEVEGIDGLEAFRRVVDYLSALQGVTSVQAVRIKHRSVGIRVQADGGGLAVQRLIALGDVLEPIAQRVRFPQRDETKLPPGAASVPAADAGGAEDDAFLEPAVPDAVYRLVP